MSHCASIMCPSPESTVSPKNVVCNPDIIDNTTTDVNANPDINSYSKTSLLLFGFKVQDTVASTLQGNIFRASTQCSQELVIIKQTNKELHRKQLSTSVQSDGSFLSVKENILKEAKIMQIITNKLPVKDRTLTKTMARFIDFFCDSQSYFLVMEDGGQCLFDFVVDAHKMIRNKQLLIREWRKFVKFIMFQLARFLHWLHSKTVGCCHLDISLENIVIQNVEWIDDANNPGYKTLKNNIFVKVCDFGLAEMFHLKTVANRIDFRCDKYCGKLLYMSPEIASRKSIYHANKSDVWSLGIVFFSMMIGAMPYSTPDVSTDRAYKHLCNGELYPLLKVWNCLQFVSKATLDLMQNMLNSDEQERFDMEQILKHEWFDKYAKYMHGCS